jgi:predicted 3-demethylubiquinone-9 3-methyltransferase (glyoxalase superfamily)
MATINPFLWFDKEAEEAANFYCSVFKNSKLTTITRAAADTPSNKKGDVMTVAFELNGRPFVALNGGPLFKFNESISFVINCETSQDVDYYWSKLIEGGQPSKCGWLKDKFGVSWQVVPTGISEVLGDKDPDRARRAMEAMLKMSKLDLEAMKRAANG